MKVTILGRGNAGCISAMKFAYYRKFVDTPVEIELIYDSNIPPVPTGQGTGIDFPKILFQNFGSNILDNFPHTIKSGIMYENWSKKNKKFFHPFPLGSYALHIEPKEFQNYVCSNLKINFKERDENIKNYDEIDADYIIDCRGTPTNLDDYIKLKNPLNCALLSELPAKQNDVKWTRAVAHPNGWCFYIPLPSKTSLGYLFNNEITTVEEAEKNFKEMFGVEKINNVFPFKQYVAKEPIINKRILLNGNKLFFLEPLEATAMSVYNTVSKFYFDSIFENVNFTITKLKIHNFITQVQDFILWQYEKNTFYNTNFWNYASDLYKKHSKEELEKIINIIKDMLEEDVRKSMTSYNYYGTWQKWNIKKMYEAKK